MFEADKLVFLAEGESANTIPAINNPKFIAAAAVDFLNDTSRVIGIKAGSTIRAYPIEIMDWHEVVNDQLGSLPVAITYSSLSGSSIAFNRRVGRDILEFGASGLLYNSNSIFTDSPTATDWLQFWRIGVRGNLTDNKLASYSVFEMKWQKWKQLHPGSEVLSRSTGFNRPYGAYPYGDYRTDSTKILFDLDADMDSIGLVLSPKEKILGINVAGMAKGYALSLFPGSKFSLLQDEVNREPVVVIGNEEAGFIVAYSRRTNNDQVLDFSMVDSMDTPMLRDQNNRLWTIFGELNEDERVKLNRLESNMAYWFIWKTFFKDIDLLL